MGYNVEFSSFGFAIPLIFFKIMLFWTLFAQPSFGVNPVTTALFVLFAFGAILYALADLRGAPGTRIPPGPKFFHFHAVFGKMLKK